MALVLDDTIGGEDSNTYISLADAETYFESRAYKDAWANATDGDKDIALVQATRTIDASYEFSGVKASRTQALRWPRSGAYTCDGYSISSEIIPEGIRNATCEQALEILKRDTTTLPSSLTRGVKSAKICEMEFESSWSFAPQDISKEADLQISGNCLGTKKSSQCRLVRF